MYSRYVIHINVFLFLFDFLEIRSNYQTISSFSFFLISPKQSLILVLEFLSQ